MINSYPAAFVDILKATEDAGFTMSSDPLTGSLLRTLAASKPGGRFLELGTGTGLSTSWILDGMDEYSIMTSVDVDPVVLHVANRFLGQDPRLQFALTDGSEWLSANKGQQYDFIFADTWHGKYLMLDEVLEMLLPGGLYIVDDMLPQANWPEGHDLKAKKLRHDLSMRKDLSVTILDWATGIIVAVKTS